MNTQTLGALAAELEAMHDMRFRVHARLLHEGIGGIEMTAKQTPLVDLMRIHADDVHSAHGYNKTSHLLSQAADEIDRLRAELTEARKPDCFICAYWFACRTDLKNDCSGGDKFTRKRDPVRLYEKEGKV